MRRMFVGVTNNIHGDEPPNSKHKAAYQYDVKFKHGTLGKGNCVVILDCIKDLIQSHYPYFHPKKYLKKYLKKLFVITK